MKAQNTTVRPTQKKTFSINNMYATLKNYAKKCKQTHRRMLLS